METNEIKKLEQLEKLTARYFRALKSPEDKTENNVSQIKFVNYYELGCVITDILKMCILTLDQQADKISETNKNPVNVSLILEMVLEMFPLAEFEFLSEISDMFIPKNNNINS